MPKRKCIQSAKSLTDLVPVIQKYKAKMGDAAKEIVHGDFQTLFDAHPEVDGIRWKQCSPLGPCENETETMQRPFESIIEDVQYKLTSHVSLRAIPYADPTLFDSGYDRQDNDWVSPWNDRRVENPILLDSLTALEEKLFDYEKPLTMAFGNHVQVTVTRKDLTLEPVADDTLLESMQQ